MISQLGNALIVFGSTLFGLIYYLVQSRSYNMHLDNVFDNADYRELFVAQGQNLSETQNNFRKFLKAVKVDNKVLLSDLVHSLHRLAMQAVSLQFVNAILTSLVFIIVIILLYWFEPLGFWISLSFILGVLVNSLLAYITVKHSCVNAARLLIEAGTGNDPKQVSFKYGWNSAVVNMTGVISIYVLGFLLFFIIFKRFYLAEDHSIEELTLWSVVMCGYSVGVALTSVFYREAASQTGKGILIGSDMIGPFNANSDRDGTIYSNLQVSNMLSNIYMNNMSAVMDFLCVFSIILTVTLTFTSHGEKLNKENFSAMYFPMIILSFNILTSVFISAFCGNFSRDDPNAKTYAGRNQRYQIYFGFITNMIVYILIPILVYPSWFDIGAQEVWAEKAISKWEIYLCLFIGLILQMLLILYSEYFTSIDKAPVKSVSINLERNVGFSVISASMIHEISQWGIVFIISLWCYFAFLLAGFLGIISMAAGLIGNPILFLSLNLASNNYSEAFRLSRLVGTVSTVTGRLKELSFAGSIFGNFAHMLNTTGCLVVNIFCIGAHLIISQNMGDRIWNAYGVIGFLFGVGLALFLKGTASLCIKRVSELTFVDEDDSKQQRQSGNLHDAVDFFLEQYRHVVWRVFLNMALCMISIFFLGLLFGVRTLVPYLIGLNYMSLYLNMRSIIGGNMLKNARIEYEKRTGYDEARDDTKEMSPPKQICMIGTAVDLAPASHTITDVCFNTLFCIIVAAVMVNWGYFRTWMDAIIEANKAVDHPDDSGSSGGGDQSGFWTKVGEGIDTIVDAIGDFFTDLFTKGNVK